MRRMLLTARLCGELGHNDVTAALAHMKRMKSALKVLHTWAAFPPMDVREVRALCERALDPNVKAKWAPRATGNDTND